VFGFRRILLTAALPVAVAGCQGYQPKPLDLEAHRSVWAERSPGRDGVVAFAQQLAAQSQSPSVYDPSDGLTLAEAEVVALVFNPELRLARARAAVAQASAQYAGLWEDPIFSLDVLRIIESVPEPWILGTSLGFTIPLSGRLDAEQDRAAAEYQTALARVAQNEWEVIVELRTTWLEWSSAKLQADVTMELVERLQHIVGIVERLEQVGEIPRLESRLFKIEAMARSTDARELQARATLLELAIKALLGLRPESPIAFEAILSLPSPEFPQDSREQLLERTNPVLAVARAEYEVAEQILRREIRKQYPDLDIGPAYENEEDQSRIGFTGSLPIPILNRNRGGIAEAQAEREARRAAFEAQYEQLVQQLARAQIDLEFRKQLTQDLEANLIPLVEDQVRDAQRMIELGEVNTLVQLESVVRRAEAKLKLVEARQAEALAANRVRMLIGPDRLANDKNRTDNP
jgi:cobalt-zinc-cadmium efflux system outer membrane protein